MKPVTFNCALTVDSAVFCVHLGKLRVALVKRGTEPYKNSWALPGGFVETNEETHDAAARELFEETGLRGIALSRFSSYDKVGRNPRGRTIAVAFMGVTKMVPLAAGDDAADAQWIVPSQVGALAFDHSDILRDALYCLRRDVFLRPLAAPLLRSTFTAAALFDVYCCLLGQALHPEKIVNYLLGANIIKHKSQGYAFTNKNRPPAEALWQDCEQK